MDFYSVSKENCLKIRDEFLFGYNNIAVLYRRSEGTDVCGEDSRSYEIIYLWNNCCNSSKDFLSYLLALNETYQIQLKSGDVIGIKINGKVIFYKFSHSSNDVFNNIWKNFFEIQSFTAREKEVIVRDLHQTNCVFDILDGKRIALADLDFKKTNIYALDGESYYPHGDKSDLIITDYFLYKFVDMDVKSINPYIKPFFDIKSAIAYFTYETGKQKNKDKKSLLLLDRRELYLVKDFCQLADLA